MSGETNFSLINEYVNFVLMGRREAAERPQAVALSDDRELRIRSPLIGRNSAGHEITARFENSGEQTNSLYGQDSSNGVRSFLVDEDRRLWIRADGIFEYPDPVFLDSASITTIYSPPANYNAVVEVEISNDDAVAQTFDLYIDPTGTDTTALMRRLRTYSQDPNAIPARLGPYPLDPNGQIAGQASANNSIAVTVYPKLFRNDSVLPG